MKTKKAEHPLSFVFSAAIYHLTTYFVFGILASSLFGYRELFTRPIIADYYVPYGSVAMLIGPILQAIRGLLFGLAFLPLRKFLRNERLGWLWLWLIFVVVGILGTPAAAPSSIEGAIYTKLPMGFHLLGLPEIGLQTLVFSLLLHRKLRAQEHPLPAMASRLLQAAVSSCISFVGYTVISLVFAFAAGVQVDKGSADFRVLGQFFAPLALIFIFSAFGKGKILVRHLYLYLLSAASIWLYQALILGSGGLAYSIIAPLLPVLISLLLASKSKEAIPSTRASPE